MNFFDLHCDTITECTCKGQSLYTNDLEISLEKSKEIKKYVQCFAVFMPENLQNQEAISYFERNYNYLLNQISTHTSNISLCKNYVDIFDTVNNHRCAAILTVEGGNAVAGDLSRINTLASQGVRIMTLTWNGKTEFGDGAEIENPAGLTKFGIKAVSLMEEHGIVIDVSHLSDPCFEDVVKYTRKPFIATHSNMRSICNNKRNLTDAQFKIIRDRKGLVGLNFHTYFVNGKEDYTLADLKRHIDHMLELGGEDIISIGSDFDGAVMPSFIQDISYIPSLYDGLLSTGYDEDLLNKIFYSNAINFAKKMFI